MRNRLNVRDGRRIDWVLEKEEEEEVERGWVKRVLGRKLVDEIRLIVFYFWVLESVF